MGGVSSSTPSPDGGSFSPVLYEWSWSDAVFVCLGTGGTGGLWDVGAGSI